MTHPDRTPIETVWLWLGQPDHGNEHLLMVQVQEPGVGVVFRPLMAVNRESALHEQTRELAGQAATELGVRAVLRQYEVTRVGTETLVTNAAADPVVVEQIEPQS